jgi:hypothetical protein
VKLFHYCCSHSAAGILSDGVLRPHPNPILGNLPLIWLTDLDTPDRAALGLSSRLISCDRTEYRVEVDTDAATHWPTFARRFPHGRRALETAEGVLPMHWYVSEQLIPIAALLEASDV